MAAAAAAKSLQSCPTVCNPIDSSPPGSLVPGILQARTLEWVAISFSNAWKGKVKVKSLSHVRLPATPWTAAYQAPPAMGPSRQEYWSGVPLPSPVQLHSPFLIFWAERGVESIIYLFGYNIYRLFSHKNIGEENLIYVYYINKVMISWVGSRGFYICV